MDTAELLLRSADGEILGDTASAALRQEIQSFGDRLRLQPARSVRIVDGRGGPVGHRHRGRPHRPRSPLMTITLPLPLRTYQYRPLTVFSLLPTDTDRVLPQLFEMCVKGGRASRSRTDARDYDGYRRALLQSGNLVGFEDERDQAMIDGWLRSCVVDMGAVGRANKGEQMLAVAPLTLAVYRAGLPKERQRHRGIDDAVYCLLLDAIDRQGSGNAAAELRELVTCTIGRGLTIGPGPKWEPRLEEPEKLDIGALLAFRFVEGFAMADARETNGTAADSSMPGVASELGTTLMNHLQTYGERLPVPAFDVDVRGVDGAGRL